MTDAARPPRRELPTDPWSLPPMGAAFDEALESGLAELDLQASAAASEVARRSYEAHARLLFDWNQAINLTAIREPVDIARRHTIDSLSAVPLLLAEAPPGAALLDIGSGGGYPGLPLAAALPLAHVTLLDSVGKKARFLEVAGAVVAGVLAEEVGIAGEDAAATEGEDADIQHDHAPDTTGIDAVNERAEDLAAEPELRGAWDVVTSRAVGSLAEVLELSLPLTREGGLVVAWKREDEGDGLRADLRGAGSIIRAAGGGRPRVLPVEAPSLPGHRLVVVPKERPTPKAYPRPAGVRRRVR